MKKKNFLVAMLSLVLFFGLGSQFALAAPSSTPSEVLASVVDTGIDESLSLVQVVMQNYWGYIIVFFIIVGLLGLAKKFGKLGSR
jgi:Na+/H+ antiporter NhaC